MIPVTRNFLGLIEGDSTNDLSLPYQVLNQVKAQVDSFYMSPSGTNWRRPAWVNKAVTGTTSSSVAGRIVADLAQNPYTHCFCMIGINDSQTGPVSQATSMANMAAIATACKNAGVILVVIGPFCNGEKSPTGQNSLDTTNPGIDLFNGGAPAQVAANQPNSVYIDVRTLIWAKQEPILNAAQANSGALCAFVAASGPGIHPNPLGATMICQAVMAQLSLQ